MRKRSQRLWLIGAAGALAIGAIALAVPALQDTVAFFYSPTKVFEKQASLAGKNARIGGLVEKNSVKHDDAGLLHFTITDNKHTVAVTYDKLPPDLFRECQGVVAEGKLDGEGKLIASRVIAKHDENYIPKEVADKMGAAHTKHDVPVPPVETR